MAEAGLRIRVDDSLRSVFIATCKARDTTAAQVLRAYMRSFVEEYGSDVLQGELFNVKRETSPLAKSLSAVSA